MLGVGEQAADVVREARVRRVERERLDVGKQLLLLSENKYDILTRAGPKNPPKKVSKNSSGRLS